MLARSPLAFLAVAAGMLLAGCNTGGSGSSEMVEVTQRVQRGVTPGQRMIVFDSYNGDISLRDTTAREASLTFVKRARAASREEARALLDEIRIEERGGEGEFAYQLAADGSGRTSVDVRGSVPQNTRLRLHLRNGEVALSGLRGPLDVNNENGDVRIGGAGRTTRAETRNGNVEVGLRRLPPEAEVRLRTANGDLRLTLPGTASADVEARTDAGEIDVSGFSFQDRERDQGGAGARFAGELGEGEATVNLRTQNGDITVREGTVRRLPGMAGDTSGTTSRDTTMRDTTGLDSLFTPPARSGANGDPTRPDTATSFMGPQRRQQRRPPAQQQRQQQSVPYSNTPPPLLRRPPPQADTSRAPAPVPGVPSLRRDTMMQQ